MTTKDIKIKQHYIKDIDRMYDKYFNKHMAATFDSWAFDACVIIKKRMLELKKEVELLTKLNTNI